LWLKHNVAPWELVLEKWQATSHLRVKQQNFKNDIENILKMWLLLKHHLSHTLVSAIFCHFFV